MCLELIWGLQVSLKLEVVVDLAIDREDYLAICAYERLSTGVCLILSAS